MLTVDAPVNGVRNAEMRAGFRLPPEIRAVNLPEPAMQPTGPEALLGGALLGAPRWDDVAWLRAQTGLPFLLKGILHPDDARKAMAMGCAGVVVSNHGGRTLDTAVTPLAMLPAIRTACGSDAVVLVDGGIRRGTDLIKALALGANAVLVGRPIAAALAVNGPQGAAHALRLLIDEFAVAMALCGFARPRDIARDCLAP
jgi:4-hydroxymandelate oxidase